jgi:hypothetical protein
MRSRWQLLHCIELSVGTFLPRSTFFVCALHDNSSWASDRPFVMTMGGVEEVVDFSGIVCKWAGSSSLSSMIIGLLFGAFDLVFLALPGFILISTTGRWTDGTGAGRVCWRVAEGSM